MRGSPTAVEQPQASLLRLAPQWPHKPRQFSEHSGRVGNANMTCSATSGARLISSARIITQTELFPMQLFRPAL